MNDKNVYWTLFQHEQWPMYMAATSQGLCYAESASRTLEDLIRWAETRIPGSRLLQDEAALKPYTRQFEEYFQGRRTTFTMPLDLYGTPFQVSVWNALTEIPYGQTLSYSDIAKRIDRPRSVRAVGAANGANPILIVVPCHRVIGKSGALTGYRGGLEMKEALLRKEQENCPTAVENL
ncbi:methylated-DNA--[protein]-cysteine S-methyltransferase [Paenibacillus sp. J2TS4]|uniref:methylated-DNA--[protein]-cysteine S-methyltransferase n=1 Tax=Paenibacillus sp. J2TS4 TaxID=2807194 RepID=UPI001BCC1E0B